MPRLDGIDIAHYQWEKGPVDLAVTAAIPTFWFAQKATQSTGYIDPTFARAWQTATPLFIHRLAYHWLSSTTDPVRQADHFLRVWDRTGGAMLDAEEAGITAAGCLAWCERVEELTHRPSVVYSGLYVAGGSIWKSAALRMSQYGPRPFIVAAYVTEANLKARLKATNSPDPHAWQFSSNGPVPGITGRCDMDMIHDVAAFDLACGVTAEPEPEPISPEDDMTVVIYDLREQDSDCVFIGEANAKGLNLTVWWLPLDQTGLDEMAEAILLGAVVVKASVGNMRHRRLLGQMPYGDTRNTWGPEHWRNEDELRAREEPTVAHDEVARAGVTFLKAEYEARAVRDDTLRDAQLAAWSG